MIDMQNKNSPLPWQVFKGTEKEVATKLSELPYPTAKEAKMVVYNYDNYYGGLSAAIGGWVREQIYVLFYPDMKNSE